MPLPSQLYAAGVARGDWTADPAQQAALVEFDRIDLDLRDAVPNGAWEKFTARFSEPVAVKGLYLWGGVGRGKTFLTDLLFDAVIVPKRRWHFHRFMGEVHARVRALPDTADTLAVVAKDLAADLRLLVLDEFFVGDIGDAMILGRLLDQLIAQRRHRRHHLQHRAARPVPRRPAARQLPAGDRADRKKLHRAQARKPAGLPPAPAAARRDLPRAARRRQRGRAGGAVRAPDRALPARTRALADQRPRDPGQGDGRRRGLVRLQRAVRRPARRGRLHRGRPRFPHRVRVERAALRPRQRGRRAPLRAFHR